MQYLLIDNSNTRTKLALADQHQLLEWRGIINTREVSCQSLDDLCKGLSFDRVVMCSVVPRVADIVEQWCEDKLLNINAKSKLGFGVDYPNPRQIGADRLANAAGYLARYDSAGIVVDFGTAVTFDVIDGNCNYVGGVIAPGLQSMSEYLSKNTALLPTIDPREPAAYIGKSTEEAMHAGAIFGYRGLVREIIVGLQAELGCKAHVVATGGDAALIARGLDLIESCHANLTLEGLLAIANNYA